MISRRVLAFLAPVVAGVAVTAVVVGTRSTPPERPAREPARTVRVMTVRAVDVVPVAMGFGAVEPATVWQAVAEVAGRIVERHPRLENGAILPENTLLFRIDAADYKLQEAQIEADIRATEAQLAELEIKVSNTGRSIEIERASARAAESELQRLRKLAAGGTASRSQLDEQERQTLAQRQALQQQENTLNLLPAERRLLDAQLERQRVQLEAARLDLGRTEVRLPFVARISQVDAELNEYVRVGDPLATADAIDLAEVEAHVPIHQMRAIMSFQDPAASAGQAASADSLQPLPFDPTEPGLLARAGLSARVRPSGLDVQWEAKVSRLSPTLDPQTRTVGVIVSVQEPYRRARPGERPPLIKGMFVEVEVTGRKLSGVLAVPRSAMSGGSVYVVDEDNRLRRRSIEVGLSQPEFVVVRAGLAAGERVVVSDVTPAIEGMLLDPRDVGPDAVRSMGLDGAPQP